MLKANELRIGNWVNNGHYNTTVSALIISVIEANKQEFFPISLTPELLVKCGFNRDVDYDGDPLWSMSNSLLYLFIQPDESLMSCYGNYKIEDSHGFGFTRITYLHQLQNLIFALTEKELNIEL